MTHKISIQSSFLVLKVDSLISEIDNKHILEDLLLHLEKESTQCIVDIAEIEIMNSVGLNFLIAVLRETKKVGGSMTIINPSPQVLRLFEITKLAAIFNLSSSLQDAMLASK